ncbi:MAG: MsnO8 family LLM class oxidoreductase, partial [Rhodospirillales bacterium]|nr:MsnO8 family LLM class oxidoreductase [Rhodospirillales bacterium]
NPNAAQAAQHFPAQLRDLLAWLAGERLVEGHPFRDIRAMPAGPTVPEVWVLGRADYGAQVAAPFGLPYCFAHFITDGAGAAEALETYRLGYRPSARHPRPQAALCVWALAADSAAEATRLTSSRVLARLWRDRGIFAPLPSPEEAAAYAYAPGEAQRAAGIAERAIHGTRDAVAARLRALGADMGVDEIAVLTTVHDAEARRRSYTLLAEAFAGEAAVRAA